MTLTTWIVVAMAWLGSFTQPASSAQSGTVDLLIRVFDGAEEVTSETQVAVYRAGARTEPVAAGVVTPEAVVFTVPVGFYDVRAVRERDGRVEGLRWAERLTVQHYPDEGGRHLEVVNLDGAYGALEIRRPGDPPGRPVAWEAFAFRPGDHATVIGTAVPGGGYGLLSLEGGTYDVAVRTAGTLVWHTGVEVPRGRTGLLRIE